jgi:Ni/Co efflux regulator RcnB
MMTKRLLLVAGLVAAIATPVAADQKSHGAQSKKAEKNERTTYDDHQTTVSVHFSTGEQRVLREYYAPRYQSLPPGLRKKVARGGQLPPGWQKKLQPFPIEVERQLAPLPPYYSRGVMDGHAVIFNTKSHVVIDATVLY